MFTKGPPGEGGKEGRGSSIIRVPTARADSISPSKCLILFLVLFETVSCSPNQAHIHYTAEAGLGRPSLRLYRLSAGITGATNTWLIIACLIKTSGAREAAVSKVPVTAESVCYFESN